MVKKQPEITEKTKQSIIAAFCTIYKEKPIEKIRVQEISVLAGYNRSTFYQYFTDIYELRTQVEDRVLDEMKGWIAGGIAPTSEELIKHMIHVLNSQQIELSSLLGEYGSARFLKRWEEEIPFEGIETYLSADHPHIDYLISFHISTCISIIQTWLKNQMDLSIEELVTLINRLYLSGVAQYLPNKQELQE